MSSASPQKARNVGFGTLRWGSSINKAELGVFALGNAA